MTSTDARVETQLTSDVTAGDIVLPVNSVASFGAADTIWLERTGTNEEQTTVTGVGASSLHASVSMDHPSGSYVTRKTKAFHMAQALATAVNTAGVSVAGRFGPDQSGVIQAQAYAGGLILTFVTATGATSRYGIGGITAAEWKAARQVGFKTTVLALNTEPGMVCSMTHPDMPGGHGEFRVTSWRLNRDYSIDLQGRTTTDSMYDLISGPKPADVVPEPSAEEILFDTGVPGALSGTPRLGDYGPFAIDDMSIASDASSAPRSGRRPCSAKATTWPLTSSPWHRLIPGLI